MKTRIDEFITQHAIEDVRKKSLSIWRMTLHFWLMITNREKIKAAVAGIFREFKVA